MYINLPYSIKDEGKKLGARFDIIKKSWYVIDEDEFDLFELVKINVPYIIKDVVKQNGGIWDKNDKCWKTNNFNLDNINNIINDPKINKLIIKKNELMKNPQVKLMNDINSMNSIFDAYNENKYSDKMTFPRNL